MFYWYFFLLKCADIIVVIYKIYLFWQNINLLLQIVITCLVVVSSKKFVCFYRMQRREAAGDLAKKTQEGVLKGPFTQRDIYRKAWSHLKTKEHVFAALDVLIESGWIKEMRDISHGKTVCTYTLNQHVHTKGLA